MKTVAGFLFALAAAVLLAVAGVSGQEGKAPGPDELVRKLLPDDWSARREAWAHLDRCLPDVYSYLGEREGMGATPYRRVLMSAEGAELARQDGAEFADAAARKEVRVALRDGSPEAGGCPAGWVDVLAVVARSPGARARDPGSALAVAVLLAELLTVKGRFLSASVTRTDAAGLKVSLEWSQGSPTWSYEEAATFTADFDRGGALAEFSKAQRSFEKHGRR